MTTKKAYVLALALAIVGAVVMFVTNSWVPMLVAVVLMLGAIVVASAAAARASRGRRAPVPR